MLFFQSDFWAKIPKNFLYSKAEKGIRAKSHVVDSRKAKKKRRSGETVRCGAFLSKMFSEVFTSSGHA